jgi:hypothetical protein
LVNILIMAHWLILVVAAASCNPQITGFQLSPGTARHRLNQAKSGVNLCRLKRQCGHISSLRGSSAAESQSGELIFSTTNALHGEVQVRELVKDGENDQTVVRALWFSACPGVWQSAVQMRREDEKIEPDFSILPFPSSRAHAFASALVEQPKNASTIGAFCQSAMLLGLGGGTLAGWLLTSLPELALLKCSELDPDVLQVCKYFGLNTSDPRLTLQLGDGLEHAAQAKAEGRCTILMCRRQSIRIVILEAKKTNSTSNLSGNF